MATRLTDRGITALKPADKSYLVFDSEVSGLALRVYETGRKTFIFDWRDHGRQRRVTIGKFPTWTIGKARTQASKLRLKADTGETVAPGRGERVVDLITAWKEVVRLTRRPGTVMSYFSLIDDHIIPAFGHFDPRAISRNGVEKWHAEIAQKTPISANRAMAVLSAFLTWLENDERIERNVARRLRRQPESARHTFLNADEITAAHTALDADRDRNAALALRLLLLTGARVGEVLTMKSEQIDLSRKVWIKRHRTRKRSAFTLCRCSPRR